MECKGIGGCYLSQGLLFHVVDPVVLLAGLVVD